MIDVLLADSDSIMRQGLREILKAFPGIRVIAEAPDGVKTLSLTGVHRPDVVLLDIRLPDIDGVDVVRRLTALPRPPHVIVFTTLDKDAHIRAALRSGAQGFLLKGAEPADVRRAVRAVAAGHAALSPAVTRQVVDGLRGRAAFVPRDARALLEGLTERERRVLHGAAQGLSNAEVAQELHLSLSTVKTHMVRVLDKLGLDNRVQAALFVQEAGFL